MLTRKSTGDGFAGISDTDAAALGKSLGEKSKTRYALLAQELRVILQQYDTNTRQKIITAYTVAGGDSTVLNDALSLLAMSDSIKSAWWASPWYISLSTISAAASGYHGYKRNNSIGWAVGWFLLGGMFPILVPVVAVAQGYAKPKGA